MRLTAPILAAAISLPALAADLTIDDLAPPESGFVLRIHNWSAARAALAETPMWKLTERPEFKAWFSTIWQDEIFEEARKEFEDLGIEPDEFPQPAGHVGFATWPGDAGALAVLFAADFGDGAQDAYDLLLDAAQRSEDRGEVTLEFDDEGDYEIVTLTEIINLDERQTRKDELEAIENNERLTWEQQEELWLLQEDPTQPPPTRYALAGNWIFSTIEHDHLADALARFDGEDLPSLADSRELAPLRAKVAGTHADMVIPPSAVDRFFDTITENFAMFLPVPLDGPLGLDQIAGFAAGMSLDAPDGQMEANFFIPLDEPTGIWSLISELDTFAPPAFAPSDAVSVAAFAINFDAVLPLARDFVMSIPEGQRAEIEAGLTAFSFVGGPILQSMGPEVYIATHYDRPFGPESERGIAAIKVKNEAVIAASLTQYAQAMGAEPRDFLGNQIWEAPDFVGDAFAVGLGAGWAFIGAPTEVEDAFRTLANENPDALAANPAFTRSITPLRPRAAAYTYGDFVPGAEYNQWLAQNLEDYVRAIYGDEEWTDEDFIQYMLEELQKDPTVRFLKDAPDMKMLRDATGPSVQDLLLTPDGLEARWLIRRPE